MNLIKRVYKQGIFILLPLSALSAFFEWKMLPISILIGGILGLANLKGLAWGVEGLIGTHRPRGKIIFFSLLRFFILTCILIILAILKLINFLGILIGFTVILILLIKEGLRVVKESSVKNMTDKS